MIAHLEGVVLWRVGDELVVTAGGVGYQVMADARDVREGERLALWIHSITGETGTRLFGFGTTDERDWFVQLLAVDGVGPKTAFAIRKAGANPHNAESLCSVKGVGKKTAEKIVEHFGAAA